MSDLNLKMPKTLHNELELLAQGEGISLNQYIVYALTQKVTAEKLGLDLTKLSPKQLNFLASIQMRSLEQVKQERAELEAAIAELGPPATAEEVAQYFAESEPGEPEPDLNPLAVERLKQQLSRLAS